MISSKPGKQVEDDDLGFCFSESEDENGPPKKNDDDLPEVELRINLDNKYVKEDIALLSSLCSDIVS